MKMQKMFFFCILAPPLLNRKIALLEIPPNMKLLLVSHTQWLQIHNGGHTRTDTCIHAQIHIWNTHTHRAM